MENRRGLIYCRINSEDPVNKGAVQKCIGLVNGLEQLGWKADIVWFNGNGVLFNDVILSNFLFSDNTESWRNILFNHFLFDGVVSRRIDFTKYKIFLIRYPMSHPGFIWMLKKAKKTNPALKILLEVPTYPYDLEHKNIFRKLQQKLDSVFNGLLKRYVDLVIHYGEFPSIFGIPAIGIMNGVDVSAIKLSKAFPKEGILRLLAVGNWNFWHGLDRLLIGLAEYSRLNDKTIGIELTIVGSGRELPFYQELVKRFGLAQKVRFIPPIEGAALDELFDNADIGIGCLGIHRKKVVLDSSLKHRQYSARGIPFILSTTDPDFPRELPWVHYVSNDDSQLSILELLEFFVSVYSQTNVRTEIRNYAKKNLDWSQKLSGIPGIAMKD